MSTRGKRVAALVALVVAFALPKHVECGFPGGKCSREASFHRTCTYWETEPFGFYLIESLVGNDVGFAYTSGEDCR